MITFYTWMSLGPTDTQESLSGPAKKAHSGVHWSLPVAPPHERAGSITAKHSLFPLAGITALEEKVRVILL